MEKKKTLKNYKRKKMRLLVVFIISVYFKAISTQESCFQSYCNCDYVNQILNCLSYTSFTQLDFKLNQVAWKEIQFFSFLSLKLNPNLNLEGLKVNTSVIPKITFANLNAFDIDYNPLKKLEYIGNGNKIELTLTNSRWLFESANSDYCKLSAGREFIFSGLRISRLNINFGDLISSSKLCPLMFFNTTIDSMELLRPTGTLNFEPVVLAGEKLNINIYELIITGGFSAFPRVLTEASILNRDLFTSIKSLELRNTYITLVEEGLLEKFESLKTMKLFNVKLKDLLKIGAKWLENLNSQFSIDLDLAELTADIFNVNRFQLHLGDDLNFEDDDLCLFEKFPHKNLVFPFIEDSSTMPCSCTIYFLYKYYQKFKPFLTMNEIKLVPTHCLDINSILLQEQLEYCDLERQLNECKGDVTETKLTTTITTATNKPKSCINQQYGCECNFEVFNYLGCNNPSINEVPADFSTTDRIKWNYVSFVGSSIKTITEFNSLELDDKAVILVRDIDNFGPRIFSKVLTQSNYQFIVEESNLFSLGRNLVFSNANLSLLEFNECSFYSRILMNAFEGATIDTFLIKSPKNLSNSLEFQPQPLFRDVNIRKFKIDSAYDSFTTYFSIDSFTLPPRLFKALEELDIINTQLFFIDGDNINELENLKVLKLNNVNIIKVLEKNLSEVHWLSVKQIKKLFIGREYETGFAFQDKYLCDFKAMHEQMNVYIYDSVDTQNGPICTCTLFWFYRNLDFEALKNDENAMYVPKCIKNLGNLNNLTEKLNQCLNNVNIETFCSPTPSTTISDASTNTISSTSTTVSTSSTATSTTSTTTTTITTTTTTTKTFGSTIVIENSSNIKEDVGYYGFIVLAILFGFLLIGLIYLFLKLKNTQRQLNDLVLNQMQNSFSLNTIKA